jgi:hypothetical protein
VKGFSKPGFLIAQAVAKSCHKFVQCNTVWIVRVGELCPSPLPCSPER